MKSSTANYENCDIVKTKKKALKIANSRGKSPVMRDIKKAYGIINALIIEVNPCEGKDALKQIDTLLWELMHDND